MNTSVILIGLIGLLIVGQAGLLFLYIRQQRFFAQFTKNIDEPDLKAALRHLHIQFKQLENAIARQASEVANLGAESHAYFQRWGFVRFNPYSDTGGDQSFCFCLLTREAHGIIVTSLHSREQTRIYAKLIRSGKVEGNVLSKEEEACLAQAVNHGKSSKN